ncbi:hypothetical protein OQA88_9634 [Cercophora sp. LCS_1]
MKTKLSDLPDDVLLLVIADVDSARSVRALALQNRRFASLIRSEGWRVFVRSRFTSISIPAPSKPQNPSWQQLADSLTWQSRCWDKRSIRFVSLRDEAELRPQPLGRQTLFHPVIDAHVNPDTREEVVVWGAGEDIVARYRERKDSPFEVSKVTWARSSGKTNNLTAGHDDVTAISIIDDTGITNQGRAIIAGRYNGRISLLSAEPDRFGERLVDFRTTQPPVTGLETGETPDAYTDPINSIDVLRDGTGPLIAASTKFSVHIYPLPGDGVVEALPSATYDLKERSFSSSLSTLRQNEQLCHATWMGQSSLMALAVKGGEEPLRYLAITPSGCAQREAAKNKRVQEKFDLKSFKICPHSLQPVQPMASSKGGTPLLLSAWRDGTCRLQDLRTPSAFDMVYQDDVDTAGSMEVLLTYGTERFVGGGMDGATLKIFDFRWTRSYHHTLGLPCKTIKPYPAPSQPFSRPPMIDGWGGACNHVANAPCSWHGLSQHSYYRPNGTFLFAHAVSDVMAKHRVQSDRRRTGNPRNQHQRRQAILWDNQNAIWSLARASDTSPNFYIGVSGGIIEANLQTSNIPKGGRLGRDPNFGFLDGETGGAGYLSEAIWPAYMETGDGRFAGRNQRSFRLPPIIKTSGENPENESCLKNAHRRLDAQFARYSGPPIYPDP